MLTEAEILSQHQASLRIARERCETLKMNAADPIPSGRAYRQLQEAIKRIEGSCRQIAHWRGDARWLVLGMIYADASKLSAGLFGRRKWAKFGELSKLFEGGIRRADELATRKTEKPGTLILPNNPSSWLVERPPLIIQ